MRVYQLTGLFFTLLALLAAPASQAKEYRYQYQRIVDTKGSVDVDLSYLAGNLVVTASPDNRLIIDAVKRIDAVSMDEAEIAADHIEIRLEQQGQRITVGTHYLRISNRSPNFWQKVLGRGSDESWGEVDYQIQIPDGSKLTARSTTGRITATHLRGDLAIISSAANIELSSIEGAVSIENSSGSTKGELLYGPVSVRQPMGSIDLSWVEGDVKVKTTTATVTVRQERGALDIMTTTGSIDVQTNLDSQRDCFIESESGNIKLSLPELASGTLSAVSKAGEIKTEIPIAISSMSKQKLVGDFGEGGTRISLNSISGDVTVARF